MKGSLRLECRRLDGRLFQNRGPATGNVLFWFLVCDCWNAPILSSNCMHYEGGDHETVDRDCVYGCFVAGQSPWAPA